MVAYRRWRQPGKCRDTRIVQEAYDKKWVSYDLKARTARGLTDYQFRAPAEWFAEVYTSTDPPAPTVVTCCTGRTRTRRSTSTTTCTGREAEMSTFVARAIRCPNCATEQEREIASSVNIMRSPHVRERILDQTFQVFECKPCGRRFIYTGEFSYVDLSRRQLFGVFPPSAESDWAVCEQRTTDAFRKTLGDDAPSIAQPFGEGLVIRCGVGFPRCARSSSLPTPASTMYLSRPPSSTCCAAPTTSPSTPPIGRG